MQHLKKNRKFNRTNKQRQALLVGLVKNLVQHERITTTVAKAKSLRPMVEKLITHGRAGSTGSPRTLAKRRYLATRTDATTAKKICDTIAPRYTGRAGGYTRIIKLPPRPSDSSPMAIIEFVK
ncbi:MAG: 50S ribosomal protein L17 [Parcubacteria group bacterium GW2011_GWB1_48_6]|nr:MAG: 50S ribosomal protein L17 [Parcubacteria group bacterium GW2011_GWB1_48_6]HXK35557.1 50S ribosomal protein L17 [Candidatus Paceibacterota bacterium]